MQSKSKIIARVFSALYLSTASLTIGFIPHDGYAATETGKANPFSKKSGMYQVHELTDVLTSAQSKKEKDLAAHNIVALLASGGKVSFNAEGIDTHYYSESVYTQANRVGDSSFFGVRGKTQERTDQEWREALRALTYAYQYLSSEKGVNRIFDVWKMLYPTDKIEAGQNHTIKNHVRSIYFLYYLTGTVQGDNQTSFSKAQELLRNGAYGNDLENAGLHFSDNDMHGKRSLLKYNNTDFETFVKQCQKEYSEQQGNVREERPRKRNIRIERPVEDNALDLHEMRDDNSKEDTLPMPMEKLGEDKLNEGGGVPLTIRLPEESIPEKKREKPKFGALTQSKKLLQDVKLDYRETEIKKLIDDGTFSDKTLKSYRESRYTYDGQMQLIPVEKWELLDAYCYALYGEHLISSRELERQKALAQLSTEVTYFYSPDQALKALIEKEDLSVDDKEKLEKTFTDFNTLDGLTKLALKINDRIYAAFEAYHKALHDGEELLPPYQKRLREARKSFLKEVAYMPVEAKKVLNWMDQPVIDKKTVKLIKKAFTETRITDNGEFVNTIDDQTLKALTVYFQILHPNAGDIVSQKITNLRKAASTLGKALGKYNSEPVKRLIGFVKKEKLEENDLSYIDKTVKSYSISNHTFKLSMVIKNEDLNALDDYSRALHKRNLVSEEQRQTRNAIQKLSEDVQQFYTDEENLLKVIENLDKDKIDQILMKASKNIGSLDLILNINDNKLAAFEKFFEFKHPDEHFVSKGAKKHRNAVTHLSVALKGSYDESLRDFYVLVNKQIKGQMKENDVVSFDKTVLRYWTHNYDTKIQLDIKSAHLKAFEDYYRELTNEDLLSEDQQRKRKALEKLVASMKDKIFDGKDALTKISTPDKIDDAFITSLEFKTDSGKALAQYFLDLYDGKEDTDAQEWAQWVAYIKEQLAEQQ